MKKYFLCLALMLCDTANAQELRDLADAAVLHVRSGWVFPKTIGDFERDEPAVTTVGVAQDGVAHYRLKSGGAQITATVYVYAPTTSAMDGTLEGAKSAINPKSKSYMVDLFAEGSFRVGSSPILLGHKVIYKYGYGSDSSTDYLYFLDTENWIVKIRMSATGLEKQTFQKMDSFVRAQPWNSLGLSQGTCNGEACNLDKAVAIHGPLEEMWALLYTENRVDDIFPSTKLSCSAAAMAAALATDVKRSDDGKTHIELLLSCKHDAGSKISFFRLPLSDDFIEAVEKESPEGMSLRGSLLFCAYSDGKRTYFTQMHDGNLTEAQIENILKSIVADRTVDFAVANKKGKEAQLRRRFLE